MRDRIILSGITIYGHHGCSEEERKVGQHIEIDVELEVKNSIACKTDNLKDAVNYVEVYELIETIVKGESKNLLESLAEDITEKILKKFDQVQSVDITLGKNPAPFEGNIKKAAIRIRRSRSE